LRPRNLGNKNKSQSWTTKHRSEARPITEAQESSGLITAVGLPQKNIDVGDYRRSVVAAAIAIPNRYHGRCKSVYVAVDTGGTGESAGDHARQLVHATAIR
jgi:hypothetical protein